MRALSARWAEWMSNTFVASNRQSKRCICQHRPTADSVRQIHRLGDGRPGGDKRVVQAVEESAAAVVGFTLAGIDPRDQRAGVAEDHSFSPWRLNFSAMASEISASWPLSGGPGSRRSAVAS